MRHRLKGRKLGRTGAHREALERNLVTSLFVYGRVITTLQKAKEFRGTAERMITLAKAGGLANFRRILRTVQDRAVARSAPSVFRRELLAFARCLGIAAESACERSLTLDPNPGNFAVQGGRLRYIDDDVTVGRDALGIEDAFLARIAEYPGVPDEIWSQYVERFACEIDALEDPAFTARLAQRVLFAARLRQGTERWARLFAERARKRGRGAP